VVAATLGKIARDTNCKLGRVWELIETRAVDVEAVACAAAEAEHVVAVADAHVSLATTMRTSSDAATVDDARSSRARVVAPSA